MMPDSLEWSKSNNSSYYVSSFAILHLQRQEEGEKGNRLTIPPPFHQKQYNHHLTDIPGK